MASDANSNLSGPGERTGWLKAVDAISTLCGWVSAAMILVSVAITCQMIFVRFVLNQSTIWQTEAVYLPDGCSDADRPALRPETARPR